MVQSLEDGFATAHKTKCPFTILSNNHSPCYSPKGTENYAHTKIHTQMFAAVLFLVAKTWKQPQFPSVGD